MRHKVIQTIYKRVGKDTLASYQHDAGIMTYHPEHHHLHVDDWAHFSLRVKTSDPDPTTWPIIGTSSKQSFCLVNSGNCSSNYGYCKDTSGTILEAGDIPNAGFGIYNGCGLDQGIFPGYLDIYTQQQNNPMMLGNICNGTFHIVSITDPKNNFLESNENNNWAVVPITLAKQIAPYGTSSFHASANGLKLNFTNTSPSNTPYLWDYGDGKWDTIYNPNHVYAKAGTYTVSLISLNKCYSLTSQTITVNELLVYENSGFNLTIYQNPIAENSFVTYYVFEKKSIELTILDMAGRIIRNFTLEPETLGAQTFVLPNEVLLLSRGIYSLRISDKSGNSELKKMVIN
jgi:hypothetical protein